MHFLPLNSGALQTFFIDTCFEWFKNQIKAYAEKHDLITVILFLGSLWAPFAAKFKKNVENLIVLKFDKNNTMT